MPVLVREGLFIGNINDAAEVISNGSSEITHVLSLLSSPFITFFSDWRRGFEIQTKEIEKVYKGEKRDPGNGSGNSNEEVPSHRGKLLYNLELVGADLKILRMAVPLRDMENENLLDYLDICLDFIERGRREGAILVHCFAGISRSASVVTAYLMKTERLSQEDALESLRQCSNCVCPNDGFLEQLKMFEEMGFKVDHASPLYKKFHLKILDFATFLVKLLPKLLVKILRLVSGTK
uniref:protein-tyrosine-phosphatase n=1 Tax=Araucaria cunninghamii TaxID=56994 RepID=A0A0D6QZK1_ARACU